MLNTHTSRTFYTNLILSRLKEKERAKTHVKRPLWIKGDGLDTISITNFKTKL